MHVLIILQLSRSSRLHQKWISGENKERKTTLQETQAHEVSNLISIAQC